MTRVVSSGATSNGDVVFYDDTEWALSGGSAIGGFGDVQGAPPPPSKAAPATPPPQASGPGVAIDNSQPSLAMTLFFPTAGIFPSRWGSGDTGGSFIGEIGIFAGNFGPGGSPLAAGQLLPINQNQAVFSILGTTYGGDGRSNFALPT